MMDTDQPGAELDDVQKPETLPCPYKGLLPYTEEDREYFFGREDDRETIVANALTASLTLLYGPSGVGKSSVLMAGVRPDLEALAGTTVVVFRDWRELDPPAPALLKREVAATVARKIGLPFETDGAESLDVLLDRAFAAAKEADDARPGGKGRSAVSKLGTVVIILDQFEEYFFYHPNEGRDNGFDAELARVINRHDFDVNVVLSLREDSLAMLDRFQGRVPNLFANYLRLGHLTIASARRAIVEPLKLYNTKNDPDVDLQPELVEQLLEDVRPDIAVGLSGRGKLEKKAEKSDAERDRIAAPYLQMVLLRLWKVGTAKTPPRLDLETYDKELGGAEKIIQGHLGEIMDGMEADRQAICALLFDRLVTPAGSKIALSLAELTDFAKTKFPGEPDEAIAVHVREALDPLTGPLARVLQRVPHPDKADDLMQFRYEIAHDMLGPAVLDWTRRYRSAREYLRKVAIGAGVAAAVALVAFIGYEMRQMSRAGTEARAQAKREREQGQVLLANQLAAQAELARTQPTGGIVRSVQLALESLKRRPTVAARQTVLSGISLLPRPRARVPMEAEVTALAFSEDGSRLAVAAEDGMVKVARVEDGKEVARVSHGGPAGDLALSPDGTRLLTIGKGAVSNQWSYAPPPPMQVFGPGSAGVIPVPTPGSSQPPPVADKSLRLWNVDVTKEIRQFQAGDSVALARFTADGKHLVVASVTQQVSDPFSDPFALPVPVPVASSALAADSKTRRRIVRKVSAAAFAPVAVSPPVVAVAVRVYVSETGKDVRTIESKAVTFAVSPDGALLATLEFDGKIQVVQPLTGETVYRASPPATPAAYNEYLVFSQDGERLARVSETTVQVIQLKTGVAAPPMNFNRYMGNGSFGFAQGSDELVAADSYGVGVVDLARGGFKRFFQLPEYSASVVVSPDGRYVMTAPERRYAVPPQYAPTPFGVASVAPQTLVTIPALAFDNKVRVYDTNPFREVARIEADGGVTALRFSPDGRRVATGGQDKAAQIWESSANREVWSDARGGGQVNVSVFSPGGQYLAAATTALPPVPQAPPSYAPPGQGMAQAPAKTAPVPAPSQKTVLRVDRMPKGEDPRRLGFSIDLDRPVLGLEFSSDGRLLAVGESQSQGVAVPPAHQRFFLRSWRRDKTTVVRKTAFAPVYMPPQAPMSMDTLRVFDLSGQEVGKFTSGSPPTAFALSGSAMAFGQIETTIQTAVVGGTLGNPLKIDGPVSGLVLSPDGSVVVTVDSHGTGRVHRVNPWNEILKFTTDGGIGMLSFSRDGKTFAYTTLGDLTNVPKHAEVRNGRVFRLATSQIAPQPPSSSILHLVDTVTGNEIARKMFSPWERLYGLSPSGRYALINDYSMLRLWDSRSFAEPVTIREHFSTSVVAFSPDEKTLAILGFDIPPAQVPPAPELPAPPTVRPASFTVRAVSFAPVAASDLIEFHEIPSGKLVSKSQRLELSPGKLEFSPDGRSVLASSWDSVKVIAVADGKVKGQRQTPSAPLALGFSADGKFGLVAVSDGLTRLEIANVQHEPWVKLPGPLTAAEFNAEGTRLTAVGPGAEVQTFDLSGKSVARSELKVGGAVMLGDDGASFASAGSLGYIRIHGLPSAPSRPEVDRLAVDRPVSALCFDESGQTLAVSSWDGPPQIWSLAKGKELPIFEAEGRETLVALSRDGGRLAAGSVEGDVRVLDTVSGKPLVRVKHGGSLYRIAFNADGSQLITQGYDSVRIWEVKKGTEIARVSLDRISFDRPAFYQSNYAVSLDPDGRYLLTLDPGNTLGAVPLKPEDLIKASCERLTRPLDKDVWEQFFPKDEKYAPVCSGTHAIATPGSK